MNRIRQVVFAACAAWALLGAAARGQEHVVTISNPLGLSWPWELVHVDLPAGAAAGLGGCVVQGHLRPIQLEPGVQVNGQAVDRVWTLVSLGGQRADGTTVQRSELQQTEIRFVPGRAESALKVEERADRWRISNGVCELELARFSGELSGKTLRQLGGLLRGVRPAGGDAWLGVHELDSDARVKSAESRILARGPVYVDLLYRFELEGVTAAARAEATSDGVAGDAAAQAATAFWQLRLRVVAGDPWVEVLESYDLPQGNHQHLLRFLPEHGFDTSMTVRWFDYGRFGGNTNLIFAPLEKREKQVGPFVHLRPRWNQQPGGSQDFLITTGGPSPDPRTPDQRPEAYRAEAPAVGIVAAFPSRWINPYAQTIAVYCENGNSAYARFPLNRGQRAWALLVGPRSLFDNTGKLNNLVRRRADWTLSKQIHNTILEWPRDPAKAGPHILLSRSQLEQLRSDWSARTDNPTMAVVREAMESYRSLREERTRLGADAKANSERIRQIDRRLGETDMQLLALISGEDVRPPRLPSAQLWIERRYQDDFLNPTGHTRRLKIEIPVADLFSGGKPIGGAAQAAIGYIFSDPDHWPGWMNGWLPGNPNFHTDKYMIAVFAAAMLLDHPHAADWMAYGRREFDDDVRRVLYAPDGVGYECPGYATFSSSLQMDMARIFVNTAMGNPVAQNPLWKRTGQWHRHLITPPDQRIGIRHKAPIGDTHRWGLSDGHHFGKIAKFFKESDPAFASEMMGMWKLYVDQGMKLDLLNSVLDADLSIPPADPRGMDWSSRSWHGFGAIMRHRYGHSRESHVTFKAGHARGHYHNDELSYHAYLAGQPVSLDYNCSYTPRGDHAALHNSMTFGRTGPFRHTGDTREVQAAEQIGSAARLGFFATHPLADLAVAERTADRLGFSPIEPDDAKFQYPYPSRQTAAGPITHRRMLALVKQADGQPLNDYLVICDETISRDAQQVNVHLLARDVKVDGPLILAEGQLENRIAVFIAQAAEPRIEVGRWFYHDAWMEGPMDWAAMPGESMQAWRERLDAVRKQKNWASFPPADFKPRYLARDEASDWPARIKATDGAALMIPPGWTGRWTYGEYQKWLRIHTKPGTPVLWVLYNAPEGDPMPTFSSLPDGGVAIELGGQRDQISLSSGGGFTLLRDGQKTSLLEPGTLPELGQLKPEKGR